MCELLLADWVWCKTRSTFGTGRGWFDLGVSQAHHPQGENGTGAPGWLATREMGDELTALLLEPNLHSTRMDRPIEPPLLRTPAGAAPLRTLRTLLTLHILLAGACRTPSARWPWSCCRTRRCSSARTLWRRQSCRCGVGGQACGRCGCSSTHATSGALRAGLCWASSLGE